MVERVTGNTPCGGEGTVDGDGPGIKVALDQRITGIGVRDV